MSKMLLSSALSLAFIFSVVAAPVSARSIRKDEVENMPIPRASYSPDPFTRTLTPEPEQKTCMVTAVDKRDTALITALDKFHSSTKTALETRKEAIKKAWNLSDDKERRVAIKMAMDVFKDFAKKAVKELKEARKSAWRQYEVDRKACHVNGWDVRMKDFHELHVW
jgi:hypothetical protein